MSNKRIASAAKTNRGLAVLSVLLALGVLVADLQIPLGVAGGVLYVVVVLLSRWSPRRRATWYAAVGTSGLAIVGLFFSPQAGGIMWMVLLNRALTIFAIWVTAIFCLQFKQSEANLSSLVENTQDLIWSFDRQSRLLTFNTAFARIVKEVMGIEVHVGMSLNMPDFEQRRAWWASRCSRALGGEQFTEEYPAKLSLPDRDFEVSFNPILEHGEVTGVSCFMRDITQRKRAEENLHASENRYRTLFQTAADAIFTLRMTSEGPRIVDCNFAGLKMFGYSHQAMVGKPPVELSPPVQPDGSSSAQKLLQVAKAALAGEPQFLESVQRRADGSLFDAEVTVARVKFDPEISLQATVRDVTERKQAEGEREKLITILETQNKELDRFAYTISHDLKTPLITIRGYLGVLEEDLAQGNSGEVKADLARIAGGAATMSELLSNVLELSRIGRLINAPQDVALGDLADEVLTMFSAEIAQRNVRIQVAPDLPLLYGDRVRLREVLQNLLENALKYMGDQPDPRIEIGSRQCPDETICFVRDNGLGIDPGYHETIFGLFDQLDPTAEGCGIGLALCKRIIEMHRGRIWVESEGMGCGSTFYFTNLQPDSCPA